MTKSSNSEESIPDQERRNKNVKSKKMTKLQTYQKFKT